MQCHSWSFWAGRCLSKGVIQLVRTPPIWSLFILAICYFGCLNIPKDMLTFLIFNFSLFHLYLYLVLLAWSKALHLDIFFLWLNTAWDIFKQIGAYKIKVIQHLILPTNSAEIYANKCTAACLLNFADAACIWYGKRMYSGYLTWQSLYDVNCQMDRQWVVWTTWNF
jgi:hypothetical protein